MRGSKYKGYQLYVSTKIVHFGQDLLMIFCSVDQNIPLESPKNPKGSVLNSHAMYHGVR